MDGGHDTTTEGDTYTEKRTGRGRLAELARPSQTILSKGAPARRTIKTAACGAADRKKLFMEAGGGGSAPAGWLSEAVRKVHRTLTPPPSSEDASLRATRSAAPDQRQEPEGLIVIFISFIDAFFCGCALSGKETFQAF
jgi:hypothetical protein